MAKKIQITEKLKKHIKALYFEDDRKPMKIYKMTGVHPDEVRKIVYNKI